MVSKMKEMRKRENANKGFKEWLKMSLMKARHDNYVKKKIKKIEKQNKKEQKRYEEQK